MSLLTIIQNVSSDLGLEVPNYVVGNPNSGVRQLLTLANREGQDQSSRGQWKCLRKQNTFTLALTSSQGAMNGTVISASDYDYILNDTFINLTDRMPITGPLNEVLIEEYQLLGYAGPYQQWYLLGGNLYIIPTPSVAASCQFQYISKHWCESNAAVGQSEFLADTDLPRLDSSLVELGITWRWMRRKGLDYSEEFATYEKRLNDALARDGGAPRLYMDDGPMSRTPGIVVPQGSWNL